VQHPNETCAWCLLTSSDALAAPKWEESSPALEAIIARVQLMGQGVRPYIPSIMFGEQRQSCWPS
jgi:hypothetical protein